MYPVSEQNSQIHQRVADGAHLPVEHRDEATDIERAQHHVVEFEVAMEQRRSRRVRWQAVHQPSGELVHRRLLAGLRSLPALAPTAHLPFDKSGRLAERGQSARVDVHRMQIREGVHHRFADPAARAGLVRDFGRLVVPHDQTVPSLHKVKG